MAIIIAAITVVFIICLVIALKARDNYPVFTDEQLLNQHYRFLGELEASRRHFSTNYLLGKQKGSPAEHELARRGYDIKKLLTERQAAEREGRAMNWQACLSPQSGNRPDRKP